MPPNSTGLIPESDVRRLKQFRRAIDTIFSSNLALKCSAHASSQRGGESSDYKPENVLDEDHLWTYWAPSEKERRSHWIQFRATSGKVKFNVVRIQEAIGLGQRIKKHEIYVDDRKMVANGTTVGYKKLHRLEKGAVEAFSVRIKIVKAKGVPLISSFGLHFDPFWNPQGEVDS